MQARGREGRASEGLPQVAYLPVTLMGSASLRLTFQGWEVRNFFKRTPLSAGSCQWNKITLRLGASVSEIGHEYKDGDADY